MPRKGMRSFFFSHKADSSSASHCPSPSRSTATPSIPRRSISDAAMAKGVEEAEAMIMKWDADTSAYAKVTSIFYESKKEAHDFIKCVNDLQKAMHFMVSENSSSEMVVRAQRLMQIAMKRLQKEFYQILSTNRAYLDPESVSTRSSRLSARSSTSDYDDDVGPEDEIRTAGDSISEVEQVSSNAMDDLRSIAECMISSGYGKECVRIYKIIRKSIVDEGIYRLGVEKLSSSQIHKMDWEIVELKIKNWLEGIKISITTLFTGERILCDHVFAASDSMRESCFAEISKEGATLLFEFPRLLVSKSKRSPDMAFRTLDVYTAISDNWPDIESIFSFESTSSVRLHALTTLSKLGESVRMMLSEFESVIQKDSSKSPVAGGGLHPLTQYVMNYLSHLADYSSILGDIIGDSPPPVQSPLPEFYFESSDTDNTPAPAISVRLAWIILFLLCKLDGKAKQYKEVSLSYLFLANNLQHVVSKVRTSNLRYLLGDEWISMHESKLRQFAANYERLGWGHVISSMPENPKAAISPEEAKETFRKFNLEFEQAYRKQSSYIVPDPKLRDEIKASIARKLDSVYQEFYETHRETLATIRNAEMLIRFAPEDVRNCLSDLFYGTGSGDSMSVSSTSSSSSPRRRHR
ncbi:hypothetical protein AAG906_014577 [Vitis piasezkii]|uniref:Exocyst subunit Exo70 family protein n=4 Tax=Vitis vinifera TaxID=29760 RepID=F6HQX6_VITVI